jgi:uncharacterized membrane protein YczE
MSRAIAVAKTRPTTFNWLRLLVGLWVFALGIALMVRADLGVSSWDVLHDALHKLTPITFGQAVVAISVLVVLVSSAMGVKPGVGTIANVLFVGVFTDALLLTGLLDDLGSLHLMVRVGALIGGIGAIALGSALYIGANLGAGPRDSLMLATARRFGVTPGRARMVIEGSVLALGAFLGGAVGVGTAIFVVVIGPAIDGAFRLFGMQTATPERGSQLE